MIHDLPNGTRVRVRVVTPSDDHVAIVVLAADVVELKTREPILPAALAA